MNEKASYIVQPLSDLLREEDEEVRKQGVKGREMGEVKDSNIIQPLSGWLREGGEEEVRVRR